MAGVSTKEIKTRIRSMRSTKQITKAMEMVAASKLLKAQSQVTHSRPYFENLYATITDIVNHSPQLCSPYFENRGEERTLLVVIGGDRGLAGGYNHNVLHLAHSQVRSPDCQVLPIGKKAIEFFRFRNIPMYTDTYTQASELSISDCFSMAKDLCQDYLDGKFNRICIIYTHYASVFSQTPAMLQMLPLEQTVRPGGDNREIVYEPDAETVFHTIVPEYIGGILYGALWESRTSEQAARRMAMDSATKNAEEMIDQLSSKYNQARQAAITQEITEIVAGS
jgi:F-type H+-transporting ATPase subunit gamma